jgi:hypothetical protein
MEKSKRNWIYWGGCKPQCLSSTLAVKDDRLLFRSGGDYVEVSPTEIIEVKEFGFNNPFLLITTATGRFHVGAMTGQYDDVVRFLQRHIGSDFCHSLAHRWNVFFFRKQFRLRSLFRQAK